VGLSRFFIGRPIFAWVLAIGVMLVGIFAVRTLPIAPFPDVAPPTVQISANYPGANAEVLESSVTQVIEQQLTALDGLLYFQSSSNANGSVSISVTFAKGTDPGTARVQVQTRVQQALPRLPSQVQQQGVNVTKAGNDFLIIVAIYDAKNRVQPADMGDYASRNVLPEIQRVPGVGQAQLFGTERAMRIWIDPAKLVGLRLSSADVTAAIAGQNAQVASGAIGDLPNIAGQGIAATVIVNGQLSTVAQFGNIVLRANTDGSAVRLKDVARIELGGQAYATSARLNGQAFGRYWCSVVAQRQCAGRGQGGTRPHGRVGALFPQGREVEHSLRQLALREDFHLASG